MPPIEEEITMPNAQKAQALHALNLTGHLCIYKEKGLIFPATIQDVSITETSYFITLNLPLPYPRNLTELGGSLEYLTLTDAALTMGGYAPFIIIHHPGLVAHLTPIINSPDTNRADLRHLIHQIADTGQIPS